MSDISEIQLASACAQAMSCVGMGRTDDPGLLRMVDTKDDSQILMDRDTLRGLLEFVRSS